MTRKIQTLNAISKKGLSRLPDSYLVGNDIADPDAVLVRSQVMHDMPIAASVLAIGRAGAGTNNIPTKAMSERGVVVFNAPGANANAVKELVIAGMLMGTRNIAPALTFVNGLFEHPLWRLLSNAGFLLLPPLLIEFPQHAAGQELSVAKGSRRRIGREPHVGRCLVHASRT